MLIRANTGKHPLSYVERDYVYLNKEPTGQGQKLQFRYAGPYIVQKVNSPYLFTLKDMSTGKCIPRPVHINRLKPSFVRKPNPTKYVWILPKLDI